MTQNWLWIPLEEVLLLNHVHHELVEGKDGSFLNFC